MAYYLKISEGWIVQPPIEWEEGKEVQTTNDLRKACCIADDAIGKTLVEAKNADLVAYHTSVMAPVVQHIIDPYDLATLDGISIHSKELIVRDMSEGFTRDDLHSAKAVMQSLLESNTSATWANMRYQMNINLFYALSTEFQIPFRAKLRAIHIDPDTMSISLSANKVDTHA